MSGYSWGLGTPTSATPSAAADQARLLLGKDIFFDGDFHVTPSGDWLLVEGEEAVRQAIYRRLMTRPGEYKIRPDYGVGVLSYVKKRKRPGDIKELENRIRTNLLQDPRISQVAAVVIDNQPDGLQISLAVRINGETLTFRPFVFSEVQ